MADDKPIIVVKKKGGHGGHHGGAWKIAYADFVTAMMAFFMVMWLVNSATVTTRQSIASYFRKPGIFNEGSGTPLLLGGAGILEDAYVPPSPEEKRKKLRVSVQSVPEKRAGESDRDLDKLYMREGREEPQRGKGPTEVSGLNSDKKQLEEIKKEIKIREIVRQAQGDLQELMKKMPEITKLLGQIEVKAEPDGLTIEIMDTDKMSMFDSGSPRIKRDAESAFARVTAVLKTYPNNLEISGHTDAKPFPSRTGAYTNWELSADRANAARRLIESQGFPASQIVSVVGKAATEPKLKDDPTAAPNRRITLKMKISADKPIVTEGENANSKPLEHLIAPEADQNRTEPPLSLAITPAAGTPGPTPAPESTPTPTPTPTPEDAPEPETKRIQGIERNDRIRLPDGPPITSNPDYMPDDKIFNNSPVLGPAKLYSGR